MRLCGGTAMTTKVYDQKTGVAVAHIIGDQIILGSNGQVIATIRDHRGVYGLDKTLIGELVDNGMGKEVIHPRDTQMPAAFQKFLVKVNYRRHP
jgi:hypothetical protein